MKWTFAYLILLLGINLGVYAQSTLPYRSLNIAEDHPAFTDLEAWLSDQYQIPVTLEAFQTDSSINGWHQSFRLLHAGQRIHQGIVRLHHYQNGEASLSAPQRIPTEVGSYAQNWNGAAAIWYKSNPSVEVLEMEPRWIVQSNALQPSLMVKYRSEGVQYESALDAAGKPIHERMLSVFDKPDSTVFVNTYQPDPITVLRTVYGPVADNEDADSEELTEALSLDSISLRWSVDEGRWLLASDHAVGADFHSSWEPTNPNIDPPSFLAPNEADLQVTRSDKAFEYFHVFYHLEQTQRHLKHLGFNNLVNYPLAFDAHASTSDQSSFEPLGANSRLRFGDGGVDDGEDADVIVHEYGHAISNSAAPETNFGGERAALDEGFCDYLAISSSRRASDYQRELVFNWDGHNAFWDGRTLTNDRTYPTDKTFDIYADGILWASAIAEISDFIGLDVTDQIMINSVYEWYPNMLLSDAARLFLRSDSILNDGAYSEVASIILCDRGLLNGCEDTLLNTLPISAPYITNTEDFAFNNEPLYIFPNGTEILSVEVIDLHGRTIEEYTLPDDGALFYPYNGEVLRQGTYIVRLHSNDGPHSFKIVRTWL